jgi:hypothetical protein
MGEAKVTFKTNSHQVPGSNARLPRMRKSRISDYLRARPRAINPTRVNEAKQRIQRIFWAMKWILILPLSAYILVWLMLILADFFKY